MEEEHGHICPCSFLLRCKALFTFTLTLMFLKVLHPL